MNNLQWMNDQIKNILQGKIKLKKQRKKAYLNLSEKSQYFVNKPATSYLGLKRLDLAEVKTILR